MPKRSKHPGPFSTAIAMRIGFEVRFRSASARASDAFKQLECPLTNSPQNDLYRAIRLNWNKTATSLLSVRVVCPIQNVLVTALLAACASVACNLYA